jgi:hypothetical protein
MSDLSIIVDGEIYATSKSSNIIAEIYLDYRGNYFPFSQWTDFSSILNMWSYNMLDHLGKFKSHFILYFMDGPYRMDVAKDKDMKMTVECVNSRDDDMVVFSFTCNYVDFLSALYQAMKKMSTLMFDNNMQTGKTKPVYIQFISTANDLKTAIDSLK